MPATQPMNLLADDLDLTLADGAQVWPELRGARIFVTGGTGFFGRWLLESFVHANDALNLQASAFVLTRRPDAFARGAGHLAAHRAITVVEGDVRSFAFPAGSFSHVIHAAADSSTGLDRRDPALMFDTLLDGTRRVLEFAKRSGARRLLCTSSGAVYGRQPSSMTHVDEDFRGGPDSTDARQVYAEGKRAAEMLCAAHADAALEPVIARGFAFVGPYLPIDAHFAIGNFVRDVLAGGPIQVLGDGSPFRSYLYAADLAVWLWTMLVRGAPMRAYNVGSDEAASIEDIARTIGQIFDLPATIARARTPGAPVERYVPSIDRARRELGLEVRVPLADAIRKTVRWHTLHHPKERS